MADQTTTIPKGWKMTTLGEVADVNPTEIIKIGTKAKYVGMESLNPFTRKISKFEIKDFSGGMKFRNGDILLARITPCLENGKTAFVDILELNEVGFGSTEYIVIREIDKISNKKFLYYLSISPRFRELAIKSMTGTSGRQRVQTDQLINESLIIPDYSEQRAIAAVLSSFDDKIELLREQNKTLEAIAQTIFKEWFVNFNFPDADGKPYKTSGGKMIDSELGAIPEGWRVGKIKDLIDILSGFAFSSSDFSQDGEYKLVTIKNVQDRNFVFDITDKISEIPEKMPNYCKLDSGDILLSLTGNVGRVCLVIGNDFLLNQRVAKLKSKNEMDYAFSYLLFLQDSIFYLLQSIASGTAQQNLSPIQTKEIKIIIADRKILDQFGMVANKLIQKINDNNSQIQTLSKLRDTLLPKLMKGEIRVKVLNYDFND
ncbi:MAG: restriction endonuclease subunit S [Chloroherpetonaceae bacterium]|nr:restriction endonuclease subunit S [bacterium]